jgi:hypothetical protein
MSDPSGAHLRVEVLADVATALAAATDVDAVSAALFSVLCPRFADSCELALPSRDGAIWRVASGPSAMSRRLRTPVPDRPTSARVLGLRRAIVAPLMSAETSVGELAVAMGASGRTFSAGDRDLVRVVAQLTGRTVDMLVSADLQRDRAGG